MIALIILYALRGTHFSEVPSGWNSLRNKDQTFTSYEQLTVTQERLNRSLNSINVQLQVLRRSSGIASSTRLFVPFVSDSRLDLVRQLVRIDTVDQEFGTWSNFIFIRSMIEQVSVIGSKDDLVIIKREQERKV